MVSGPSITAIQALSSPSSPEAQLAALKQLKNDVVGHDQRKELLVKHGAIQPLVNIIRAASSNDELKLQATLIIASFANGGPAFVAPLVAADVTACLVNVLSANASSKLVTAVLQALKNLAAAWAKAEQSVNVTTQSYSLAIIDGPVAETFLNILRQPRSRVAHQQIKLVADILALVAAEREHTQSLLTDAGVLDTLAESIAGDASTVSRMFGNNSNEWSNVADVDILPSIIRASSSIISGSMYRTHSFFCSPHLRELFHDGNAASYNDVSHHLDPFGSELLPHLYTPNVGSLSFNNGGSRAFPALGSLQQGEQRASGVGMYGLRHADSADVVVHQANAVCAFLLSLARAFQKPVDRLAALRLLASVNNAVDDGEAPQRSGLFLKKRERERQIAMLGVPLAAQLVKQSAEGKPTGSSDSTLIDDQQEKDEHRQVKEQACEVLALLIEENKVLQGSAVDAGAIKHVCPLLKRTFDNVTPSRPMWSPKSASSPPTSSDPTCKLGQRGLPSEILHTMKVRQGALETIAALAEKEDPYRKALVEAGVVTCIIDSLKPFPPNYLMDMATNSRQVSVKDGNTTPVILAACNAARIISRSVSLLRTSLIDAGISKPIFALLNHQELNVQIKATNAVANLVLEFSPMREDLLKEGVITTLTEHARRSEMGLRLNSLWALKHLVLSAPRETKVSALEELGPGWLVSAIRGEHSQSSEGQAALSSSVGSSGGVSVGLSTANAAGEQVDILNPASNMDVDEDSGDDEVGPDEDDEDGEVMVDDQSGMQYQHSSVRSTLHPPHSSIAPAGDVKAYLAILRDMEGNQALQAKRDDLAVQEQALDLIRNLLNGEECMHMFDHLMQQIGSGVIFNLLTEKLSPLPPNTRFPASNTSGNGKPNGGGGAVLYYPTEIVLSAVHVLNHIAASTRHKQLLIAQQQLLQAWLPHFAHTDRRVRVMCVWVVNSLTWVDDDNDRVACRQRVLELRRIGIEAAVRAMAGDVDLDIKERVKTAVRQLDQV